MELTPFLRVQLNADTFTIGSLNSLFEEKEAMKIVYVREDSSLKVCLCLFCTSGILRSIFQQDGNINDMKETHESDIYIFINNTDVKDVAQALLYNNAIDMKTHENVSYNFSLSVSRQVILTI